MGLEDRIAVNGAPTGSDVTVSDNSQAPYLTDMDVASEAKKSFISRQSATASHKEVAASEVEDREQDVMSKTATKAGHLRLSAEREPEPNTILISQADNQCSEGSHILANARPACDVSLAINIKVTSSEATIPAFTITVPARKCTQWSELRGEVIAASWEQARVDSLRNAHFRLEEDGKAASLTIAPTRIDAQTAFPGKIYEGWYHRIIRGSQSVYKVDVKIEI